MSRPSAFICFSVVLSPSICFGLKTPRSVASRTCSNFR
jgi:hypothetical protein